jgi:hypothetical protein
LRTINKQTRDKIVAQALTEIQFARTYKQGKIQNWQKNEQMLYGRKQKSDESRANIELGRMHEFVHSLLSKVDNPLTFKFIKRKPSQKKRVERLNSLRAYDAQRDNWDIKDIVGKKQAIVYGRAIYCYYAESPDGVYRPHLENVDVYDFLVDPAVGGIELDKAMFMGRYGVVKTREQLKRGIKYGYYLKYETQNLIDGASNATESTTEETNKQPRQTDQNVWTVNREITGSDKFKFWEWYTTYEGTRYYLCMTNDGNVIRVEELSNIFDSDEFPFWSYAAFPDLTEFWTPSYCDYVREVFMAQSVSINQMFDNAEQINKPQKVVNVNAIESLAELKFRRDGIIRTKGNVDADKAIQMLRVPAIETPIKVYQLLDVIQEKASGVTAGSKGLSDEDKVGIYEGNEANAADRFGLFNKSYSFGYQRFAQLYEHGVREHLKKKVAVDILGADGVEIEEIGYSDIFRKQDKFSVMVEASNSEAALSTVAQRTRITFLQSQAANPIQNQKKAYEVQAQIAGFEDDQIKQLMDTSEFGDADIMSEAERDIEMLLDGKTVKPNRAANAAYLQRFVDYSTDNQEDISESQFMRLIAYMEEVKPIVMRNMARAVTMQAMNAPNTMDSAMARPSTQDTVIAQMGQQSVNQPI